MIRRIFKQPTMCFSKFIRNKPHLNVGTIGHVDHGKTTLTSAITKYLSTKGTGKFMDYKSIDKSPEETSRGITINNTTIEYQTEKYHYSHVDCPGHEDYVKNMITGAAKMDAGILVVSAPDGAMPQTREHILLCQQIGVKQIIVYLNKIDLMSDPEMHEIVIMEVNEILDQYGYNSSETKVVKGSALMALNNENEEQGSKTIQELLDIMDSTLIVPERKTDLPFMLSVENTFAIEGRGLVVVGTIDQGKVKPGEEVEVVGKNKYFKTTVTGIETFKKTLDYGEAGDNVGLLLRGLTRDQVQRGMIIAKPGVVKNHRCFEAQVYFCTEEEGGRKKGFYTGYKPQAFIRTADIASEIVLPDNCKIGMPGDNLKIKLRLSIPAFIELGQRFALRESGKTIGHGIITEILNDDSIPEQVGRISKSQRQNQD